MRFKLRGENPATPAPDRVVETRFEYDAFGNLVRKIEAATFANAASTTDFAFDTVGRPTRTLYNGFYDPATRTGESADAANRLRPEAAIPHDTLGNPHRLGTPTGGQARGSQDKETGEKERI